MPFLFRCDKTTETPRTLAEEILALTKMNWNNTQFDGREPITVRAARQVGSILKYIAKDGLVEPRYDTDQQNSAVFDHLASATGGVSIFASSSRAHCASRFVLCLVPERAIDWQAGVSFRF
jgi:hypothetical protein